LISKLRSGCIPEQENSVQNKVKTTPNGKRSAGTITDAHALKTPGIEPRNKISIKPVEQVFGRLKFHSPNSRINLSSPIFAALDC